MCMHQFAGIYSAWLIVLYFLQAKSLIKIGLKIGLLLKPVYTAVPQYQFHNKKPKGSTFQYHY